MWKMSDINQNNVDITPELLADLKEKAEKATRGPWVRDTDGGVYSEFSEDAPITVIENDAILEGDAGYIVAANPQVVLSLIVENEDLKSEILSYQTGCRRIDCLRAKDIDRLEKEADWLAMELEKREPTCRSCRETVCTTSCGYTGPDNWREAAREAIQESVQSED